MVSQCRDNSNSKGDKGNDKRVEQRSAQHGKQDRKLPGPKRDESAALLFLVLIDLLMNLGTQVVEITGRLAGGILGLSKRQVVGQLDEYLRLFLRLQHLLLQ